jgi:hypothetical protein
VTSSEAVAEIDNGVRQLSLGYDADYDMTGPGRGEQRNIIVNHLALVENGRCGGMSNSRSRAAEELHGKIHGWRKNEILRAGPNR